MSAIATGGSSSGYSALAQLLASTFSTRTSPDAPQIGQPERLVSTSALSSTPSDSVDLSDHAKAVLAQAQKDQVLANELQTLVQSNKNSAGSNSNSILGQSSQGQLTSAQTADSISQSFAQLTGQTQSQQLLSNWTAEQAAADPVGFTDAEQAAHTQADGTISNWSVSFQDVPPAGAPSTPQEIDRWYATQGQQFLENTQGLSPGFVDAIRNHTLSFTNVSDIPDVDFRNSFTFQGGEDGAGGGGSFTFNYNAPALQAIGSANYAIFGDGYIATWPASAAQ